MKRFLLLVVLFIWTLFLLALSNQCHAIDMPTIKEVPPTMVCKDSKGLYFIAPDAVTVLVTKLGVNEHCVSVIDTTGKKHTFCNYIPTTDVCKPSYGTIL